MEPLTLPFMEFVGGLHSVTLMSIAVGVLIGAGLIASLLLRRSGSRTIRLAAEETPASSPPGHGAVKSPDRLEPTIRATPAPHGATIRFVLRSLILVGVLSTGALLAAQHFGTEALLRWSLGNLQKKSGVTLTFEKATGGPFQGEIVIHNVRASREDHVHSNFDLTASEVTIQFSAWKLLPGAQLSFNSVRIDQVSGTYQRVGLREPPSEAERTGDELWKRAKNIPIGRLEIRDATVDYSDSTVDGETLELGVAVDSLVCAPFHTGFAPYDIVFRSDIEGTVDQQPFRIHSVETPTERKTEWQATGLPIKILRGQLGGPFRWLTSGKFDVQVTQTANRNAALPVILDSRLSLREVHPGVPGHFKPAVAIAAQVAIAQIKQIPKETTLAFELKLDPQKFDLTRVEDRDRLWVQFREAAVAALLQATGLKSANPSDVDRIKERTANIIAEEGVKVLEKIQERRKAKKAAKAEKVKQAP